MHYYNDNDPKACAWLRELIAAGLIPKGEVDERSITDVSAGDLRGFVQCHWFAGIGGWSRALQLAGWPEDRPVWTGSCPCQPLSCAGSRKGHADERHLWPAFYRLISECRPPVVIGEQVSSKDGREWLSGIRADMEGLGYAIGGADLCAAGCGAPHIRQRLFWVANSKDLRFQPDSSSSRTQGRRTTESGDGIESCGLADATEQREQREQRDAASTGSQRNQSQQEPGLDCSNVGLANPSLRGQRTDGSASGNAGHAEQREQVERVGNAKDQGCGRMEDEQGQIGEREAGRYALRTERIGRLGHTAGCGRTGKNGTSEQEQGPGTRCNAGFWSSWRWHQCTDGKLRRIPAQSVLQRGTDGLPNGMDLGGAENAFPLCRKIEGRVALLKGYGNAIVPQTAAEFVRAFMEIGT